ncbi:MAG: rRNA maturation RNase YbeY [Candidatus Aminicenantes bacterium]|jgi:probable rRNA maturation factor
MIEILNNQKRHKIKIKRFRELLGELIRIYDVDDPELTLAFVNDSVIRDLNRRFLEVDAPTDVLSFPIREEGADGKYYLGDIIISVAQANKQRLEKNHSLERELEMLTVHGFLHLLGYEHFEGMEEEENRIKKLFFEKNDGN